jgi:chromosome segregation ATPase
MVFPLHYSAYLQIQDRRKKALESAAEDQRKYLTEIEQCEKHIATHQERLMAVRDERANASQTCAEYQRGEQQLSGEVRGLQNEVQRMERDYREISSSSDGRIAAFGPKIPKVLSDIKGKRFRGPVIGPIGAFVKIRRGNEDWGREIERVIGKVMSSFVVTNIDDQRTLKAILRANSCDYQHSIIVQSGGESLPRYNVGSIPDALSVNDAIVIENDLVFNTIVDQCRTEGAALFADDVEVQRYVVKSGNGDSFRHPQMQRAICKNGLTISFRGGNRATEVRTRARTYYMFLLLFTSLSPVHKLTAEYPV